MRPVTPLGIAAARLNELLTRLEGTDADPADLASLREARDLVSGLDPYLERFTTTESAPLARLAARTQSEDWAGRSSAADGYVLEQEMLSGHVEGQLLKMLVHTTQARRVLDIGMFTGYSALAMAEALPADGCVVACEIDEYAAAFAQKCFADSPVGHRIDVRVGPALETLHQLAGDGVPFDLAFIDADKGGYQSYVDALLDSALLAPQALICVDNTLMQGQPWVAAAPTANGVAIAAFNQSLADDPRVEQVILPIRDGFTMIRRTT